MTDDSAVDRDRGSSRWLLVVEVASFALLGYYVYLVMYPDGTERGMRSWSWASKACYSSAAALGQAGMRCERRYMSMSGG